MKTPDSKPDSTDRRHHQLLESLDTIIAAYDREIAELTHELQAASLHTNLARRSTPDAPALRSADFGRRAA